MAKERRTQMMQAAESDPTLAAHVVPEWLVGQDCGKPLILHFGRDRSLLFSRGQVLKRTGAPVVCCEDIAKVDALLERHTHGLLVLCHSVPESDRAKVLGRVRRLRPAFQCLFLARNLFDPHARTGESETMSTHRGPHGLVQKALELLSRSGLPRIQQLESLHLSHLQSSVLTR